MEDVTDNMPSQSEKASFTSGSGRGKETLFRVTFRNQINLTAIADQKANIIISINSILITVTLALFGSGLTISGEPFSSNYQLLAPFSILVIFCLLSAIFSILAASPKIIKRDKDPDVKSSVLFFGNFYMKSLEEHLADMEKLLNSKNDIYENLAIDLYFQGQVLNRKYFLLNIAYKLFLAGMILSVVVFIGTWFSGI